MILSLVIVLLAPPIVVGVVFAALGRKSLRMGLALILFATCYFALRYVLVAGLYHKAFHFDAFSIVGLGGIWTAVMAISGFATLKFKDSLNARDVSEANQNLRAKR